MAEVTTPTAGTAGGGPSPMLKLFLEALGGAGSAMSEGKPIGPALNKTMMGNMGNQGMLGLLKAMLSGDNELAGKFDNKGMQLSVPPSMMSFGSESLGMGNPGSYTPSTFDPTPSSAYGKTNVSPLKPNQPQSEMSPYANPSSSPLDALTAADLVGLTPGDLMKALQFKLMKDELAGKEEAGRTAAETARMNARTAQRNAATSESNSNISMLNAIKSLSKDERTAAIQNFEYAQAHGFAGTFEELQREVRTTHQKDYDRAVKGGYKGDFQTWLRDMTALGGGLTLGEKKQVAEMQTEVKNKSYFTDPKGLPNDIDKYINSEDVQNTLFQFAGEPKKLNVRKAELEAEYIRSSLISSGAKILSVTADGRTLIWKVQYKDGTTGEVKRGF